jgi:hypothetical protein
VVGEEAQRLFNDANELLDMPSAGKALESARRGGAVPG